MKGDIISMSKILVKKVKPCDLSTTMIFMLNHLHKTELGQFVVMYDKKSSTLFVNDKTPAKDIKRFVAVAGYKGRYINSPDCEIADITDYIYQKYGFKVWGILVEAYNVRRKEREDEAARREAKELYKVIHNFDVSEDSPDIFYDRERLIYHLGRLAENEGRRTAKNMVGYSTKYAFLFGYLMGNGTIDHKEGATV